MRLHYQDEGPGPVVVLLHGFPLDSTMWEYQLGALGSVYRVIAPDLRGHGKSSAPEGIYTMDAMADDVIETLDSLGIIVPVALGGLSMGGYVALSLIARYPARIRALMLMDTRAGADTPETAKARHDMAALVEHDESAEPVVTTMLPKLFSSTTRQNRPEIVARVGEQMSRTSPRGVAGTLRGLAIRPDRTADLGRIRVPTLVIAGQDDALIPIDESRRMASAIAAAQILEVPNAGHLAPLEQPETVNDALLRFLGDAKF
jgi:3-oxoadipate enol-lactonase